MVIIGYNIYYKKFMQNEIDSSNIIAVLVNNKTQARIKLSYKD